MTGQATRNLTSDRIQDALYGFARSQILFSAIDLDIFSAIDQIQNAHPQNAPVDLSTVACLSDRLGMPERSLRIFLDGLVGIGFLEKPYPEQNPLWYGLPSDVRKFLVRQSPNYIGGMVSHCKGLYENWMLLTDVVQSGQPAGGAQSLAEVETFFAELVKGLYVSNYPTAKSLAEMLQIGSPGCQGIRILDVAGGSAVWSIAMLERDSLSRATVLDYPTVIHVSESYVNKHGLSDRYDYLPGDLELMEFPEEEYDLAVLGNICHSLGEDASRNLFRNVLQALKPGGRIAIVDFVPDDNRSKPGWALLFGVNMLISTTDGDVFTRREYRQWLEASGFESFESRELESEVTVLLATKSA